MKLIDTALSLLIFTSALSLCRADFMFEIQVHSITTSNASDCGGDDSTPECETYLSTFCLREGRSTMSSNVTDCPLGVANRTYYTYYIYEPVIRNIASEHPWTGAFQLYIKAMDRDDYPEDDHIDDIYINMNVGANSQPPSRPSIYVGVRGVVSVELIIGVQCVEDFYGFDCSTHCVAQDNDQNGHYACNEDDGTLLCLQGFQNPENSCRDAVPGPMVGYATLGFLFAVSVCLNIASVITAVMLFRKLYQKSGICHGSPKSKDRAIVLKPNTVYGLTSHDGVDLKANEAYELSSRGDGIDLKTNEVYGLTSLDGAIELKPNEVYELTSPGQQIS